MTDHTEPTPTNDFLAPKSFTSAMTVPIGDYDVHITLTVTGPDAREVSKYLKLLRSVNEQAVGYIQHMFDPGHRKEDCLMEAFEDDTIVKQREDEDARLVEKLAGMKNIPQV